MPSDRGPFVRLHRYVRRIMPTILHDDSTTPQRGAPSADLPARPDTET